MESEWPGAMRVFWKVAPASMTARSGTAQFDRRGFAFQNARLLDEREAQVTQVTKHLGAVAHDAVEFEQHRVIPFLRAQHVPGENRAGLDAGERVADVVDDASDGAIERAQHVFGFNALALLLGP